MEREITFEKMEKLYKNNGFSDEKDYSLMYFLSTGCGLDQYSFVKDFAKENGIKNIVDIGCAYGFQSECFLNEDINYTGIDMWVKEEDMHNKEVFEYIKGKYPYVNVEVKQKTLAVSVLCLGWKCFLFKEDTLMNQFRGLSEDFEKSIIYMPPDSYRLVKHMFKKTTKLKNHWYLLES